MAYIYTQHIDIDHFISAGIGIGITQQGTQINAQMIVPVLKREIYETETQVEGSGGYKVEVSGAENFVIPLLGFRTGTDNNDKYSSVFKGLRFTNTFNHFTFKSNGNSFLPDGYDATFVKYQGISIRYYNPSASNTTIAIPNNINSITFDENGISNPISGGTVRNRYKFDDGFIYIVKDSAEARFVRLLRWDTSSSGEIYNPVLEKGYFSTAYYDESRQYTKPFLVDGNRIDVYGGYEFFAGGTIIKASDSGESGGKSEDGGNSGDRNPYQYPSYGTDSGSSLIFGGDGRHKKYGDSAGLDTITSNNPQEAGDISEIFGTAHIDGQGGVRIFELSENQMASLFGKLWDDNFIDSINKYGNGNAGNMLMRVYKTPIAPDDINTRNIYLGKWDTGISAMQKKQIFNKKIGTFTITEYFGSFLDYQTKLQIFLPFSGFHDLMIDKYMSKTSKPSTITVSVNCDFLAGVGVYNIETTYSDGRVIIDSFPFDLGADIPIGFAQYENATSSLFQIIGGGISAAAGAAAFGAASSAGNPVVSAIAGIGGFVGGAASAGLGLSNVNKPTYSIQGSAGRNFGFLQSDVIYLLLFQPVAAVPENASHYVGYQARITKKIGDIKENTFVKMQNVVLNQKIPADIANEIMTDLCDGFYT